MSSILILLIFLTLSFLGIPIAFSMMITGISFVLTNGGGIGNIIVPFNRLSVALGMKSLTAIFFFVELGVLMGETKVSQYLVNFLRDFLGLFIRTGRLGIITILSCAALGPLTGSAVGTTTAVGEIVIPQFNKHNYDRRYSTTLLAYSGILGTIIPPSISGLLYAVIMGLPVLGTWMSVCGGGLLYILVLIIVNYFVCKRRGFEIDESIDRRKNLKDLFKDFVKLLPVFSIPITILGSIYGGVATATEAGVIGVMITLLIGVFYFKTIKSFKQLIKVLYIASYKTSVIMFLICASFSLSYCLTTTGVVKSIVISMLSLTTNTHILLLITVGFVLILGCFMDDTPIMVLLGPVVASIMMPLGINPYHLAAVFIFACIVGLVTPPVGMALYAASAVTGVSIGDIFLYVFLYLFPALIILLLLIFVPEISLFFPKIFGLM